MNAHADLLRAHREIEAEAELLPDDVTVADQLVRLRNDILELRRQRDEWRDKYHAETARFYAFRAGLSRGS